MKLIVVLSLFFLSSLNLLHAQSQKQKACAIKGAVFVSTLRHEAEFFFFVEENEDFSDMRVFREPQRLFADQPGIWHYVDLPHLADYILFEEKNRSAADFTISYTDTPAFAGCR